LRFLRFSKATTVNREEESHAHERAGAYATVPHIYGSMLNEDFDGLLDVIRSDGG